MLEREKKEWCVVCNGDELLDSIYTCHILDHFLVESMFFEMKTKRWEKNYLKKNEPHNRRDTMFQIVWIMN